MTYLLVVTYLNGDTEAYAFDSAVERAEALAQAKAMPTVNTVGIANVESDPADLTPSFRIE